MLGRARLAERFSVRFKVGGRMAGLMRIEGLPMEFDSIDWQMLTIEAKRSRSLPPEVYGDAICEAHRLFDDLPPTKRNLAARAILALLQLATHQS
jgi:hypothetical protein